MSASSIPGTSSSASCANPDARPATLLLGLGNDLLGDDAIGLVLARLLRDHPALPGSVTVHEHDGGSLSLLDELGGANHVILVDAIATGAKPGTLHVLELDDLPRVVGALPHGLGLRESLELGSALGLPLPRTLRILAVEIADPHQLREGLGPDLLAALPNLVNLTLAQVRAPRPLEFSRWDS